MAEPVRDVLIEGAAAGDVQDLHPAADTEQRDAAFQSAAGTEHLTVKSHHHQGVDAIPDPLSPSAWATDDESVEAIESEDGRFVLGVLWHPEEDPEDHVIPALIDSAAS